MIAPDPAVYAAMPTEHLHQLLRRPDIPDDHRRTVESELARRDAAKVWGSPGSSAPPPAPASASPSASEARTEFLSSTPQATQRYPAGPQFAPGPQFGPGLQYEPGPQHEQATPEQYVAGYPGAPGSSGRRTGLIIGLVAGVLALALVVAGTFAILSLAHRRTGDRPSTAGLGVTAPPGRANGDQAWVNDMNTYCRSADQRLKAIPIPASSRTPDQVAKWLTDTATEITTMNQHLRSMPAPASARDLVTQMLDHWDQTAKGYRAAATAATAGDTEAFTTALQDAETDNVEGNAVAQQLGLGDCAAAGGL